MLDAIRRLAPRISDYGDFTREVGALSADAYANGRQLPGALFLRSAEFFMLPDDPAKTPARQRFRETMRGVYEIGEDAYLEIRYEGGKLPAYRLSPRASRGSIVASGRVAHGARAGRTEKMADAHRSVSV